MHAAVWPGRNVGQSNEASSTQDDVLEARVMNRLESCGKKQT